MEPRAKKTKPDNVPRLLDGKYFTIIKQDGTRVEAECTICKKVRKGDVRSTGNFMEHLRKSHSEIVHEVAEHRKAAKTDEKQGKFRNTVDEMMNKFTLEEVSVSGKFPLGTKFYNLMWKYYSEI